MNKTQTEENLIRGILRAHTGDLPADIQALVGYVREERLNALPREPVERLASLLREKKRAAESFNLAHRSLIEDAEGALSHDGLCKMLEELLQHQGPR